MVRPLAEISLRARPALTCDFAESIINLARIKSPSTIFDLACLIAKVKCQNAADAITIAKAARWLSIIRRDYGIAAFEEAVRDAQLDTDK